MSERTIDYCGIRFWNASAESLIETIDRERGYLVVPAAPALCDIVTDEFYYRSLRESDFAVVDSGYVALLMMLERGAPVSRISGLRFIEALLRKDAKWNLRTRRVLWVTPNEKEQQNLCEYLSREGFPPGLQSYYCAPFYKREDDFVDEALLANLDREDPDWVIVCIGGGKQEKLANEIKRRFGRRFRVACTGAAMAFLTGTQARIPVWADRMFLGWLFRIFDDPRTFGKRYWSALKLPLVLKKARRSGTTSQA